MLQCSFLLHIELQIVPYFTVDQCIAFSDSFTDPAISTCWSKAISEEWDYARDDWNDPAEQSHVAKIE